MTSRQLYEGVLIELNKENAPNILLETFNYFANKAINQYINKRYNIYDINLLTTDDLRVLKATAKLIPLKVQETYDGLTLAVDDDNNSNMATYYVDLPSDYLHLLNCIVVYNVNKTYKCYNKGDTWRVAATRLTADAYSLVLDNFWMKPSYKRPYYYIHNVNTKGKDERELTYSPITYNEKELTLPQEADETHLKYIGEGENRHINGGYKIEYSWLDEPKKILKKTTYYEEYNGSNEVVKDVKVEVLSSGQYKEGIDSHISMYIRDNEEYGTDGNGNTIVNGIGLPKTISIPTGTESSYSNVERGQSIRYGNVSKVRMEIRYGTDNTVFSLTPDPSKKGGYVYIDYIKAPQYIRLTQEEIDYTEDKSQMLEFPDYVCQEILNELVILVMENISDPKLQTFPVVSLSIANPAQALAPEAAGQSAK